MYNRTIEFHRSMVADAARTRCYQQAITQTVKPGDVVLDLGCGTGILGFFACRAGAAKVYAIEVGSVIEIARSVCRRNGLQDRVVFFQELSTRVQLPERVDVIVTETMGSFGLDEGILGSVIDARERFLREGGTILPRSIELFLVPVELPEQYTAVELWSADTFGLDFSPVRRLAVNSLAWVELLPQCFLSDPMSLVAISLADVNTSDLQAEVGFVVRQRGVCHGLGGWFAAEISEGLHLSNKPPLEAPNWCHAFFPLERPVALDEGDRVTVAIRSGANGGLWRWQVRCARPGRDGPRDRQMAAFDQSSFFGQLLAPADLQKRGYGHMPRLTARGQADLFILQSMDGSISLADIARRAQEAHPAVFPDNATAVERVRELSQKYS